jgi:hypothetical protein
MLGDAEGAAVLAQPDNATVAIANVAATANACDANDLVISKPPVVDSNLTLF